MLKKALATWRQLNKELGRGPALLYATNRVLHTLSRGKARIVPYSLYAQPIGAQAFKSIRDDPGTIIRRSAPGDPLGAKFPRPFPVIQARHAHGALCFAATVKGEFAGYIWIARNRYEEDEVRCTYVLAQPDSCVWDFDVYVDPRHRMGRTMARLWKAVDADLAASGVRWSFSRISMFNPGSAASHQRMGARKVGRSVFFVMGPLQFTLKSGWPMVPIATMRGDAPTVVLTAPSSH